MRKEKQRHPFYRLWLGFLFALLALGAALLIWGLGQGWTAVLPIATA